MDSKNFENWSDRWTKISWCPIAQVSFLLFGAFVSFIIAYGNGSVSIYMPFLSEMGAHVPELNVFSLTCIFGSFIGIIVVYYRYLVLKFILVNEYCKLQKLNSIACIIGVISWCGLAGVAAFPMSTVFSLHLLTAIIHFISAMIYIFLQSFINFYIPGLPNFWIRLRLVLCSVLLFFLFMLVIFFPLSLLTWGKIHSHPAALKKPSDMVFGITLTSAFFEWGMYGTLLAYIGTFFYEFRKYQVVIGVIPVPPKEITDEVPMQLRQEMNSSG